MPSASSKARKDRGKSKGGKSSSKVSAGAADTSIDAPKSKAISEINCTGALSSNPFGVDVQIVSFTVQAYGQEMIKDTTLELNYGRRYGLIGRNGSGKSTFLKALASGEVPIPDHMDIFLLNKEADATDMTALEAVIEKAKAEIVRLEALEEKITEEEGPESERLQQIYDRMEKLDPATFDKRAGELLFGLGFTKKTMQKQTKDLSGGWRMRVSLATALFVEPYILLLDEPTNHLDLEACVWLEEYLSHYSKILVVVSHSQDFLNGVCTNTLHLTQRRVLQTYGGNYATFVKTRAEQEEAITKQYVKQQEEIKHIKEFIASCGVYANLVRQAKSRQKILDKMIDDGLIEMPPTEHQSDFNFPSCGHLASPVLAVYDVGFAYSGKVEDMLYKNLEFGIDLDSRIVLVGPNGAGKSTLLKLLEGDLIPTQGRVQRNGHLKIAKYNQHSEDVLDFEKNPIDFMRDTFPEFNYDITVWRGRLGKYGISGDAQTKLIGTMSDGQKSSLVFCLLAQKSPHMLLFDEPTNHLDMEGIDALAKAINKFEGGMILVSHDFRLLEQVGREIWICDKKTVVKWDGTIQSYKTHLKKNMKKYES